MHPPPLSPVADDAGACLCTPPSHLRLTTLVPAHAPPPPLTPCPPPLLPPPPQQSAGKTFEVRRCEARDSKGRTAPMAGPEFMRLLLKLVPDRNRWRTGLRPFPVYTPPPAPPTEQRKQVRGGRACSSRGA